MNHPPSHHLDKIFSKQNRIANLQIVFVDIEKYSQRRSSTQIEVIDNFTRSLEEAIESIASKYYEYSQENNIVLKKDIITVPTGDGAIVIFSFDGLNDIHLEFAKELLRIINELNSDNFCQKFQEHGWCNCHDNLNLKIAISEGKGIIYRDINGNYNVAGNVINIAARLLNPADRNQIMFSEEAYRQIIDMVLDPDLIDHFIEFKEVEIKHGQKINIYQYIDSTLPFINSLPSKKLTLKEKVSDIAEKLRLRGFPIPDFNTVSQFDTEKFIPFMESFLGNSEIFNSSQKEVELEKQIFDVEED